MRKAARPYWDDGGPTNGTSSREGEKMRERGTREGGRPKGEEKTSARCATGQNFPSIVVRKSGILEKGKDC